MRVDRKKVVALLILRGDFGIQQFVSDDAPAFTINSGFVHVPITQNVQLAQCTSIFLALP